VLGAYWLCHHSKLAIEQFSAQQNWSGYECASVRIHVERCIRRLKYFDILTFLPTHLMKSIDDILYAISFIVNCYPDLINQDIEDGP
jgi:hypothetical protein